jgi:leucyl-tRNA synthetase
MEQWFFKITAYADELLEYDLPEDGEWPERTKTIQRNWIGRSEGAEVLFRIDELDADVPVFTTRPDTLFGATFFVLAPEHPLVERIANDEVRDYVKRTARRRGEERAGEDPKTGVFTGYYATNPVNDERLPVYVADYVLMEYGTGAIMSVPAHDERDFQFAEAFGLPVRTVVVPSNGETPEEGAFSAHTENEVLVNSGPFTGLPAPEAKTAIVAWLHERGRGAPAVSYRLRDWSFSRQRYWGAPIPIIHCDACGLVPVPEEDLPVVLPEVDDYRPKGVPPLASNEEWLNVACPRCGKPARREADTMDTFVDSSWYFLRYVDPRNDGAPFDRRVVDYWCPVSQYIGGIDHATGHLLYSRFFVKVMREMGLVGFGEPFARLFHQGWVQMGGSKMSKSKGNVTGPDDLVDEYGADAVRLYILFLGPADQDMEWTDTGIEGVVRFLRRLWRIVGEVAEQAPGDGVPDTPLARKASATVAKVTDDIGRRFQFHTPIAAVMELVNDLTRSPEDPAVRFAAETAVSLIQPYAPHIAEELWEQLGHERLWEQRWPTADPALLERETFELVIQVNGRVRDRVQVAADTPEEELIELAKSSSRVQAHLNGKQIRQTIVVPRKLVNLVVG